MTRFRTFSVFTLCVLFASCARNVERFRSHDTRLSMLQALGSDPTVTALAGAGPPLLALPPRALADAGAGKIGLSYKHVSAGYFDVLGISHRARARVHDRG